MRAFAVRAYRVLSIEVLDKGFEFKDLQAGTHMRSHNFQVKLHLQVPEAMFLSDPKDF